MQTLDEEFAHGYRHKILEIKHVLMYFVIIKSQMFVKKCDTKASHKYVHDSDSWIQAIAN